MPLRPGWPDGGITPFRSEKNTNWEGAYRVPCEVRWPGKIPAGVVSNGIVAHQDWLPTLLAAAGAPDAKERLLTGLRAGDMTYKVHIDGYNLLPHLTGKEKESPRRSSTRQTAARSPLFAMTIGKSSTWCSEQKQRTSGESL
jgi:arylsulfatase